VRKKKDESFDVLLENGLKSLEDVSIVREQDDATLFTNLSARQNAKPPRAWTIPDAIKENDSVEFVGREVTHVHIRRQRPVSLCGHNVLECFHLNVMEVEVVRPSVRTGKDDFTSTSSLRLNHLASRKKKERVWS
jgi:hypothetical protein